MTSDRAFDAGIAAAGIALVVSTCFAGWVLAFKAVNLQIWAWVASGNLRGADRGPGSRRRTFPKRTPP